MTPAPLVLIAELTHRCPLRCAYCSNPTKLVAREDEVSTVDWQQALAQAAAAGVRMVHFTGGEPLLRQDLEDLVGAASQGSMYATLVTSGLSAATPQRTRNRISALAARGLRSVQVSFQGARAGDGASVAGRDAFLQKLAFSRQVKRAGLSLTTNLVLRRDNLDSVADFVRLSLELGADRVELANVQFHGWAELNREQLMPTRGQVQHNRQLVAELKLSYAARVDIVHVMADYFSGRVKPCMGGWGQRALVVAPDGKVLPCHGASMLPLGHDHLGEKNLADIWYDGEAFRAFRGVAWMESPCATCSERGRDFGGCRCQAFALTGRATAAFLLPHVPLADVLTAPWRAMTRRIPRRWSSRYRTSRRP